jgi:hypothetical protein
MNAITGTLFPSRYLVDRLLVEAAPIDDATLRHQRTRLLRWWAGVEAACGPATSVRAVFDLAAMPLFAMLGYRASNARFDRGACEVHLQTPNGVPVELLVLPWASQPSSVWRRAVTAGRDSGASWCFALAPPFLSLISINGCAMRRSVDFSFPAALAEDELRRFLLLTRAEAFEASAGATSALGVFIDSARQFQEAVRTDLQAGVRDALAILTPILRSSAASREPFDEALTMLYRVLFLLFAESRDLVPHQHPIYRQAYALGTLCRHAQHLAPAPGLWDALAAVTRLSRAGCRIDDLIVRPFNGRLFARASAPTLESRHAARRPTRVSAARDRAIQQTLLALGSRRTPGGRQDICYRDLGVEQLGAVYERVLDLDPEAMPVPNVPSSRGFASGRHSARRKQSGTFYTPQDLAELVVRRTLGPLVAGRTSEEILSLRVLDPAMGSGAFLVAACRFLASACERALVDEGRWSDADIRPSDQAGLRRLVAERCLAGVDVNPIAVQLARLSLWLATLAEGRPLGFLDHRLRVGNSIVGASPEDLRHVETHRRRLRSLPLFDDGDFEGAVRQIARPLMSLSLRSDDTVEIVREKEALWLSLTGSRSPLAPWRHAANLWCARWFWPASGGSAPSAAELRAAIDALIRRDNTLSAGHLGRWIQTAAAVASRHNFFHWQIEFADVFFDEHGRAKDRGGFDAVIGNPPWEMLRRDSHSNLSDASPDLLVRFIRDSGVYSACDRGHVNLDQPLLEGAIALTRFGGRVGLVLPWGLAVDDGAAALRGRLLQDTAVDTLVGLDNSKGIFPIHRGLRFLALAAQTGGATREVRAHFGVETREAIAALSADEAGDRDAIRLTPELISRVGGATRRIPDIRHRDDLDLLDRLTREFPELGSGDGWHARFGRELNATEDRKHFGDRGLPVLEGKHLGPFSVDLRAPALRIPASTALRLLPASSFMRPRLAYRDVSGVGNRLSLIAAVVPGDAVTTHTLFCLRTPMAIEQQHFLCGLLNSYVLNAVVRMLMGGHVTTSLVEHLPAPVWSASKAQRLSARLAARLARHPRSIATAAFLQAAVAHLYGMDRRALEGLLVHFPLVGADERRRALDAYERLRSAGDPERPASAAPNGAPQ